MNSKTNSTMKMIEEASEAHPVLKGFHAAILHRLERMKVPGPVTDDSVATRLTLRAWQASDDARLLARGWGEEAEAILGEESALSGQIVLEAMIATELARTLKVLDCYPND